jgi:hypothetical protein
MEGIIKIDKFYIAKAQEGKMMPLVLHSKSDWLFQQAVII